MESFDGYVGNFKLQVGRTPPAGEAYAQELETLSRSASSPGEYVPFVGVMPAVIPERREEYEVAAGVVVLATGFRPYQPRQGEYGYQEFPEVVTLLELIRLLAEAEGGGDTLTLSGRPIRQAAMIHCVGSRQIPGIHDENEDGCLNEYCSRTCCGATLYTANLMRRNYPQTKIFDFYRDIRTYGRGQEELYTEAAKNRVVFFRFETGEEPQVFRNPDPQGSPLLVEDPERCTFPFVLAGAAMAMDVQCTVVIQGGAVFW